MPDSNPHQVKPCPTTVNLHQPDLQATPIIIIIINSITPSDHYHNNNNVFPPMVDYIP